MDAMAWRERTGTYPRGSFSDKLSVSVGRRKEAAMSTLVVEVCEVKAVYPHPNADAL